MIRGLWAYDEALMLRFPPASFILPLGTSKIAMNAQLHLDDDLASYLNEQARQERTTLDVVLNRILRRVVPGKTTTEAANTQETALKPQVTLVRDPGTGRMVLTRTAGLPPITTEMVNDILNELP